MMDSTADRNSRNPFANHVLQKMLAIGLASTIAVGAIGGFFSFHRITTEPGTETVLMDKPYFFGKGGVRPETQKPGAGWYWSSTEGIPVVTTPYKIDEPFDDLTTSNNNFIDYASYLTLRVTNSSSMIGDFGPKWYDSNLKEQYRSIVRDKVKGYTMESLLTDQPTSVALEKAIREAMGAVIKESKLPVELVDFSLGRGRPNQPVIDEMNATAQQQQRKKTMIEASAAEAQRKDAEIKRAEADRAYQDKMGMTPDQVIALESIKRFSAACQAQGSTCVINAGGSSGAVLVSPPKMK